MKNTKKIEFEILNYRGQKTYESIDVEFPESVDINDSDEVNNYLEETNRNRMDENDWCTIIDWSETSRIGDTLEYLCKSTPDQEFRKNLIAAYIRMSPVIDHLSSIEQIKIVLYSMNLSLDAVKETLLRIEEMFN